MLLHNACSSDAVNAFDARLVFDKGQHFSSTCQALHPRHFVTPELQLVALHTHYTRVAVVPHAVVIADFVAPSKSAAPSSRDTSWPTVRHFHAVVRAQRQLRRVNVSRLIANAQAAFASAIKCLLAASLLLLCAGIGFDYPGNAQVCPALKPQTLYEIIQVPWVLLPRDSTVLKRKYHVKQAQLSDLTFAIAQDLQRNLDLRGQLLSQRVQIVQRPLNANSSPCTANRSPLPACKKLHG